MVKPPRTMQPESVDLKKAGRSAGKAFEEDSFRNYMARKIDLQRKQFGLVIPPAPREESSQKTVHFAPDVIDHKRKSLGIESVLRRLRKRHGGKYKRCVVTSRKRKFNQISSAEDEDIIVRTQQVDEVEEDKSWDQNSCTQAIPIKFCTGRSDHATPVVSSQRGSTRRRSDLFFTGIVVIVNGYTNPDTETLQRLLHKHGGDLEKYETSRITHIIAEHLSTAKAKIYMKQRNPIPVCYPSWILDCVNAGRLLPHADYLIEEVRQRNPGMKTVTSLFQKSPKNCGKTIIDSSGCEKSDKIDSFSWVQSSNINGCAQHVIKALSSEEDKGVCDLTMGRGSSAPMEEKVSEETPQLNPECCSGKECLSESVCINVETTHSYLNELSSTSCEAFTTTDSCPEAQHQRKVASPDNEKDPSFQAPSFHVHSHSSGVSDSVDNEHDHMKRFAPAGSEEIPGTSGRTNEKFINGKIRTVGTDPNFLESFFASSRLSFIGSYKQRSRESSEMKTGSIKGLKRVVFHVDMDSFFAAVVLRNFPQYRDLPVVISHHGEKRTNKRNGHVVVGKDSTSECATCNYEARKFGITKGMYLGRAKQLCPHLIVLQYDFEGYEEVSQQVADILHEQAAEYKGYVENVSCDESFVELFLPESSTIQFLKKLADDIRHEICESTQCTASIGVGPNKFLAKLGTDRVKPNGSFVVENFREFLKPLELKCLPGIGYRLNKKLAEEGLRTVRDVWDLGNSAESELCRILGPGLGKKVHAFCDGKDDRPIRPVERKTIGAECNYGVRFDGEYGVDHMIAGLAKEVEKRMRHVSVLGSKLTLKVKQRKKGAPPPPKFLGHGSCYSLSKSIETPNLKAISDSLIFASMGMMLFEEMNVPKEDVRGMGIVISKLEKMNPDKKPEASASISTWITTANGIRARNCSTAVKSFDFSSQEQSNSTEYIFDQDRTVVLESTESMDLHPAYAVEPSAEDNFADIDLPPLSQIHMSQVEVLPDGIRHLVLSKMQSERLKRTEYENQTASEGQKDARFRQTNVKHLMKLAAVKAGKDEIPGDNLNGSLSLTQLNCLPLELQLQVVNGDYDRIGGFCPKTHLHHKPTSKPVGYAHPGRNPDCKIHSQKSALNDSEAAISDFKDKRDSDKEHTAQSQLLSLSSIRMQLDYTHYFEENILPWHHFLNDNLPSDVSTGIVLSYVQLCLEEDRLADVTLLLRCIRNRGDEWRFVFSELFKKVNESINVHYNMSLDSEWM